MNGIARLQNGLLKLTQYNDLLLAGLVIAVIALMILPMPTVLVDGVIATNLCLSLGMLMMSMYITSPLSFSVFPTMLLFTTLLRLSLNITTTRLILLNADAGAIIETFGNFVIAGNFVVGAVVFLILTIVQFLVIAKGSERVAEVAARFTLDAMPGKQMSIDADMRAGVIDVEEAKTRRNLVAKESQLYGAMDGAMKFVKGDAIAGLVVTAVNILGGILIGTMQIGMPMNEAVQTYSILTIGDGLVSQIPALLISITAGIVVTRVSNDESSHLGGDVGQQFLSQPKAILITGCLLFLFAFIPGFPKPHFMILALIVGSLGYVLYSASRKATHEPGPDYSAMAPAVDKAGARPHSPGKEEDFSTTVPLLIDVEASLQQNISAEAMNDAVAKVRRALYLDLGVPFPGIHLRFSDSLEAGTYLILLHEIPMSQGELRPGRVLVSEKTENLDVLNISYETGPTFLPDLPSVWVDEAHCQIMERAGIPYMDAVKVLTYHLSFVLKRHCEEFIGLQETRFLLDKMEGHHQELVKELQRVMPLQKINEILQRLAQEQISIRNLRSIFQALIEWGQKEKDPILLTEYARSSLKRYISYRYSSGQNMLAVYLLDPSV